MEKELKYDVVIVGGGTSGCACAYTCAKNGLKTLLIEKNNFLGGLMTGGLVIPIMKSSVSDLNTDYYNKLIKTAKKFNAQITYKDGNDGWLNPEICKIILDEILEFENLDILFETSVKEVLVKDNLIEKIIINSDILSIPIVSSYYVDASASAEFSYLCGCEFLNDTNEKQQHALRFIMGNIDVEKLSEFLTSIDKDENITNTYRNDLNTNNELHFTTASTWDCTRYWALDNILKEGIKEGILNEEDRAYFQIFSVAGSNSEIALNCPRINNYTNNPFLHSKELIFARKAIYRIFNFLKKKFPGCENGIISNIATITGKREERRVKTKYVFTKNDLTSSKTFKTPVLEANYAIDIHSCDKNAITIQKINKYQLPLESLMSANYDNLFVIGKILGADFVAHSALRVQKSCMSMGEAIGKYLSKQ